jgi:hypothetical protein
MTLEDVHDLVGHFAASPSSSFAHEFRGNKVPRLVAAVLLAAVAVLGLCWIVL